MKNGRLLNNLTGFAWKVICQQFWLLAVLSMLFFGLPLCAGPVAQTLLSEGVDFSGITLAVCAPEGDQTGVLLEELTGKMRDIRKYAQLKSMDHASAYTALEAGEITAILLIPENFVEGILYGENPDVTVVVREDHPLESLLTFWVGQSAADLLSAAQKGIYAVLEVTDGLDTVDPDNILIEINLEYINLALNRQNFFRERKLMPTETMDILTHYGLSLLVFLAMALAPVFYPLLSQNHFSFRRRLCTLGCGPGKQLLPVWWIMFVIQVIFASVPVWILTDSVPWGVLVLALFGSMYCSFCILLTRSVAGCGCLALVGSAFTMVISGGIVPPALLPPIIRKMDLLFPGEKLRNVMYLPVEEWGGNLTGILVWTFLLMAGSWVLLRKQLGKEGQSA